MALSGKTREELFGLAWALCDGTITREQTARLKQLVREDAEARMFYLNYIGLHAGLHWTDPHRGAVTPQAGRRSTSPVLGFLADSLHSAQDFFPQPTRFSLLIAAAVMGLLLGALGLWCAPIYHHWVRQPVPATPRVFVARLTRCADCSWADADLAPIPGQYLLPGRRLDLVEGLAEIKFESGAVVILDGPASFEPDAKNAGFLLGGSLTADVPKQALGFTIRTSRLNVVDLGTQFGVHVDTDGAAEVRVFAGSVEVARNGYPQQKVRLGANESARFDARGVRTDKPAADSKEFVRTLPPRPARVRFFTDESAWLATVGPVETFRTISSNLAQANEVTAPPARDQNLGPVLTFPAVSTGLSRGFRVTMLQPGDGPGHGFVFDDSSGNAKMPPAFVNALAVGKGDTFEDDDWQLGITSGPDLFGFACDLCDNVTSGRESLSVYGPSGQLLAVTRTIPPGADGSVVFFGVVSDTPITRISFDEDSDDDDTAIANFRFPRSSRR